MDIPPQRRPTLCANCPSLLVSSRVPSHVAMSGAARAPSRAGSAQQAHTYVDRERTSLWRGKGAVGAVGRGCLRCPCTAPASKRAHPSRSAHRNLHPAAFCAPFLTLLCAVPSPSPVFYLSQFFPRSRARPRPHAHALIATLAHASAHGAHKHAWVLSSHASPPAWRRVPLLLTPLLSLLLSLSLSRARAPACARPSVPRASVFAAPRRTAALLSTRKRGVSVLTCERVAPTLPPRPLPSSFSRLCLPRQDARCPVARRCSAQCPKRVLLAHRAASAPLTQTPACLDLHVRRGRTESSTAGPPHTPPPRGTALVWVRGRLCCLCGREESLFDSNTTRAAPCSPSPALACRRPLSPGPARPRLPPLALACACSLAVPPAPAPATRLLAPTYPAFTRPL